MQAENVKVRETMTWRMLSPTSPHSMSMKSVTILLPGIPSSSCASPYIVGTCHSCWSGSVDLTCHCVWAYTYGCYRASGKNIKANTLLLGHENRENSRNVDMSALQGLQDRHLARNSAASTEHLKPFLVGSIAALGITPCPEHFQGIVLWFGHSHAGMKAVTPFP